MCKKSTILNTLLGCGLAIFALPAEAMSLHEGDTTAGVYSSQIQTYGESTIGAITARVSRGVNPDGTNGSLGAFSEFSQTSQNVSTVDFNSGGTQIAKNSYTFGDESIVYSWKSGKQTGILNNRWAPSGAYGEVNTSDYLGVFKGRDVTIALNQNLNYFGIDWGALSSGNNFSFYNNDQLISSFTYNDINPSSPVSAKQHGGQGNAYVHFYANEANGVFNKIVLSQASGGGFESDNHSFHYGESEFNFQTERDVPFEIESTLGLLLLAMGWTGHRLILKSKLKHTLALKES